MEKIGPAIDDISKILVHQANKKMDGAIVNRLYLTFGKKHVMEM